jgi:2-oxoglutarate dehydrogenase E2 component (dihydrolipoamide succinyltransferase)
MFEVDLYPHPHLRNKTSAFEKRHGAWLTFMLLLRSHYHAATVSIVNASIEGGIRYHRNINVGIAVAPGLGLIVPVLKNADDLISACRRDQRSGRTGSRQEVKPDEVEGSTFTITNPGQFGAVSDCPSSTSQTRPFWA